MAMWFLNGRLADDELRRQISAMAAGHVGGIQVAARTGLQTPYLSEAWFEVIRLIQDAAEQHGLPVWLADEFPYPSGASGGEVILRHAEYRAWQMQATSVRVAPGADVELQLPGTVALRACSVPLIGGIARWPEAIDLEAHVGWLQHEQSLFEPSRVYLTMRRYMSNAPRPTLKWRAPAGAEAWEIWLVAAAEIADYKFFGSYVDLCNPDACRFFLATTYERYLARLGPERFSRLAGFFLDEAHPQNWSWRLPEFFRERRGYDLVEALPALWTDMGPRTARVRYDYRQSLTELFDESFMRPVAEWCREHGVQLSLEVPSTRNVVQRHADIPGIDPGHVFDPGAIRLSQLSQQVTDELTVGGKLAMEVAYFFFGIERSFPPRRFFLRRSLLDQSLGARLGPRLRFSDDRVGCVVLVGERARYSGELGDDHARERSPSPTKRLYSLLHRRHFGGGGVLAGIDGMLGSRPARSVLGANSVVHDSLLGSFTSSPPAGCSRSTNCSRPEPI
jgi:hypothetical protein